MKLDNNVNIINKTDYDLEIINNQAKNDLINLVLDSEKRYRNQVSEVANNIAYNKKKFILIAGPSSAGKTTTSKLLKDELKLKGINSIVISFDNFFINRDVTPILPDGNYDYENVDILDIPYFNIFLQDILNTGSAKMPIFDFVTGTRTHYEKIVINKNDVIIMEGIHALNPKIINFKSDDFYKIYLCLNSNFILNNKLLIPAKKLRLMRRMIRDVQSRGSSVSYTLQLWKNVCIGEDKYVKPYKLTANYLIDTTHLYEPLLYKTYLMPYLEPLSDDDKVKELINMLDKCEALEKKIVPKNSLLWEFLC